MNTPLVSILINNCNYGCFIRRAIDSALNQTYLTTEIIVVDDGSTDDSRQVIESYGDKIVSVFKKNGGQVSAFNAGFAISKGEIICFLDSDDFFEPQKVEKVVELFNSHPVIGWVFHAYKDIDELTGNCLSTYPTGQSSRLIDFRVRIVAGEKPTFAPATSSLAFHRHLLQKIFPMPEAAGCLLSDIYLKYAALFLAEGYLLNELLTSLVIHNNNHYSRKNDKALKMGIYNIYPAYYLRFNFPDIRRFADRIFGIGLGNYWHMNKRDAECQAIINSYFLKLSLLEKTQVMSRAYYHYWNSYPSLQPIVSRLRSFMK